VTLLRRAWTQLWRGALVVAICTVGLWVATHGVAGVLWADVVQVLRGVEWWRLGVLAAVWLGGLGVYSVVLAAAMPGLGVRRGLLLNLTGSAVANVIPLGGAVATGLNWRMTRLWGHSNDDFVAYCVLTNVLDVTTKLVFPLVGVGVLLAVSTPVPEPLWVVAGLCAAGLVLLGVGSVLVRLRRTALRSAARLRELLVRGWSRLLPASVAYVAAQLLLFVLSLRAVGVHPAFSVVLMAAAIERLGTLVPLTPGGTGVAEIGTVAWLVAMGVDPVGAVAGVLLYRIFLIALEIPLGGALLGGWVFLRRWGAGRALAPAARGGPA
jgi:putative heme transporter